MITSQPAAARLPLPVDDGIRDVDVVLHANFNASKRNRAQKEVETQVVAANRLAELRQGMFIVVHQILKPLDKNSDELEWHTWPYFIAEIDRDLSLLDTTNETTELEVQVYRPCGQTVSLEKSLSNGKVMTMPFGDQPLREEW